MGKEEQEKILCSLPSSLTSRSVGRSWHGFPGVSSLLRIIATSFQGNVRGGVASSVFQKGDSRKPQGVSPVKFWRGSNWISG